MTPKKLQQAFEQWTRSGEPLVLASVYETEGSTYSKTGAQMLINSAGDFRGMLSGGCLEGDLAERARAVIESGVPQAVTYDLGLNDEQLWGLGVGCDGLMRIFLQALLPANDYQPFAAMSRVYDGQEKQVAATVLESEVEGLVPGSALVTVDGKTAFTDTGGQHREAIEQQAASVLAAGESRVVELDIADATAKVLFSVLRPPPRVLVLGAGLDAEPVVRLATELGWRVTVQDHRPAYVEAGDFTSAERVVCVPVHDLQKEIDLAPFAAAIVMSHHLASDLEYLRQLATTNLEYIGLLGPRDRKRRLLEDLGELADRLTPRLHGPAGIDIGGRGPASIALSIVAEMHRELMQEDV
ncbi:MAG: XdhC/CoxI family protein [Woeseiaceae bacterium]|nr:XdhC/CoxI family protein [Woeseiaceae bacterium]